MSTRPGSAPAARPARVIAATAGTSTTHLTSRRSTTMYAMHEALAREHMREREQRARRYALSSELASAHRWSYLERRAHAAYRRHAQRAHGAAQLSAVAD
jgi:hypothetical protein